MGRRHISTHNRSVFKPSSANQRDAFQARSACFAPPACFISALALGLIVGGSAAVGQPGGCTSSVPGVDLTCTGIVTNPSPFTATSEFTVDIGTTTPTVSPATITQGSGFAGIEINAEDHGGSVNMTMGSSIQMEAESESSRDGLRLTSGATTSKTYTINIDGSIASAAAEGDGIRLEGTNYSVFNVTFGGGANVGGADNGVTVTGAQSLLLKNYGLLQGGSGDGVRIDDIGGNVSAQNRFGFSSWGAARIVGSDDGVSISYVDGRASIANNFGGKIVGFGGDGVHVHDVDDSVSVDNSLFGKIWGREDGIHISDVGDDVVVRNSFGGLIIGTRGDGVDIRDVRDDVMVVNAFGGKISGRDNGIAIDDVRDDVTIVNGFGGSIAGRWSDGVHVRDVHDGSVSVKNSFGGDISGDDDGIHIANVDDGVTIDNRFGGMVSGRDDDGIDVRDVDEDVRVDNRFGGRITGDDNGVKIHDVDGSVRIVNSFGGRIHGDGDNGVDIDNVDGNVRIDNRAGGSIEGRNDGVHVDDVDGNVRADNGSGSIRGRRGDGVDISADGNATVNNGWRGRITGTDSAIQIDAGSAEINSAGLIRGSGSSDATIKLSTEDGATINNYRGGRIVGRHYDPMDLIVEARGGAVTINNSGTMLGRIDLSDAGNSQWGNVFNNTSDHSWVFVGTSNLGDGLADAFNNTGTMFTTDPDAPEINDITELAGVETFNNGSSTKSGTIDLQDGFTGDVTTLSPTSGGSLAFNGEAGHSYLKVDSFLGSSSDSSSDQLVINGDVSGRTAIDVNNVNPGFGSYNPLGIEVVSATGEISPQNFVLKYGPIDTGLFDYDLYLNDSNEWVLASAPNRTFVELPSLVSAAQSMWHDASGVWLDRTADLRASIQHPCVSEGLKGPGEACAKPATSGAWIKGLGATESRAPEHSVSLFGTSNRYKTDYDQSGGGVVAGYDIVLRANDGQGVWLAGVMGGYLRSVVDFESSATNADFEGGAVGGYITYLKGPWFLDAKLMANIGNVDYRGSQAEKDNASVTSIGGVLDTGYRIHRGQYFIEPGATLAYVNTDIDSLAVYGTSVNFANGDSLRGRLGLRLGTTIQSERAKYEPFLGVNAWYEFLGDNAANVVSEGYALQATDSLAGAIGEVTSGVNVYSLAEDGISGFVKGNFEFGKDDYLGFGGSVGMRVAW
ncbi:outer membrane autotransporter barrel domain-containing protein [Hyphomicrobium denitrificans 1NES1]|uniref:Outer membrane autotransporter barrel domain-containing protein n=1 Tax=Hyphomicrobium denitrificans 1NES1 TaxID=670307 RepID=N0B3G7_9HYPH|nr:autotransporter domain-containing protein [Hyphomicrobium denitrificans]AGK57503.1 outer membrane autotransporter barrel domain-containing protein [Hyphomicrobium denitrificans 1NES1]